MRLGLFKYLLTFIQDAFGNYVVQYILDLGDPQFINMVVHRFMGNVCLLSTQKFSSNVIEKCIRVSCPVQRHLLVQELVDVCASGLEKLLRDSYANYVVQTALDTCDSEQRVNLVECIKPLLPAVRNTPYGKRILAKIG